MKNSYYLPQMGLSGLAKTAVGELQPVLALDDAAAPFAILDTFDQALWRSGRVLLETGGAFELFTADGETLSQPAERRGDFVADFRDGAIKHSLADMSPLRSLKPIGSGTLRHGTLALLDAEQKTHCRASLRVLTMNGGIAAAIVTLQGLRGYDRSLAELRRQIEDCGGEPLDLGRLVSHLIPAHGTFEAKPDIIIKPDETSFTAATDIIAAYIPVMRGNENGIIEDHDTEFLHNYRVAGRKIRSVLSLFKGVYREDQTLDLKARFSALMRPTGPLRDLDVYFLGRQDFHDLLPGSLQAGLDGLFDMLTVKRQAERVALAGHLTSAAYQAEIGSLANLFDRRKKLRRGPNADQAAYEYACRLIWKRYRKICDTAQAINADTTDAEIHLLRIQCKKLRYLMESFGALFPRRAFKELVGRLKTLQDSLGVFNDYSVQQISLQAFLSVGDNKTHAVTLPVAQSIAALIAVLHHKQVEERGRVVGNLTQFISPETQQTFRTLFHARKGQE